LKALPKFLKVSEMSRGGNSTLAWYVIKTAVKNDMFYVVWSAKTPVVEYTFATDTFIIQGGKILRQTFAGNLK
jgi:hypothetical protein